MLLCDGYRLQWQQRLIRTTYGGQVQQIGPYYNKLQSFGSKYEASGLIINYSANNPSKITKAYLISDRIPGKLMLTIWEYL